MGRTATRTRRVVHHIGWYWKSLMGDNHYQRYLEHRTRTHAGESVISEREYWRRRHAASESDPGARCC